MKRDYQNEGTSKSRDPKRDKTGWKAQLNTARKAKGKRKAFETGGKVWK